MKTILIRSTLFLPFLFLISCSTYNYTTSYADRSIKITADNLKDFQVLSAKTTNKLTTASSGVANAKLENLKKDYLTVILSHPNYESQEISVKRAVRPIALAKDFGLGIFTFGIPIIVDVFKSDFYKISPKTKEFNVHFEYKQSFMSDEYAKIKDSKNPDDFKDWLSKYQKSVLFQKVLDQKDSLELTIALFQETENAIDEYIASHQSSTYLPEAKKIKEDLVEAKELFKKVKIENSISAFEKYLEKYPRSLNNKEAHRLLSDAAEKTAVTSLNSIKMVHYVEDYLIPNASYFNSKELDLRKSKITKVIDAQLVKENIKSDSKKTFEYYSNLWKAFNNIRGNGLDDYLSQFDQTMAFLPKISDLLFSKIKDANSLEKQNDLIKIINSEFTHLDVYDTLNNPLITILQNAQKSSGIVKLYNVGYLPFVFNNLSERDALIGRDYYSYKDSTYHALKDITYEEVSFSNGKLNGNSKCFNGNQLRMSLNLVNNLPKEISYYQNGELVLTTTFLPNRKEYSFEFDKGVNLTLKELDKKISEGNNLLQLSNYDQAISIFEIALKNDFPETIPQNISLRKNISLAKNQKTVFLKKQEELKKEEERQRQAELERLNNLYSNTPCISGNFVSSEVDPFNSSRYEFMLFYDNKTMKFGTSNAYGRDIKYNGYGWYEISSEKINVRDNEGDSYYFYIQSSKVDIDSKCKRIYTIRKQDMINYKGVNMGGQTFNNYN
jgi:hypothetical protein